MVLAVRNEINVNLIELYFIFFITGSSSTGSLFFDYHRILLHLSNTAKRNGHKFYWLYENTFSMEKSTKDEISRYPLFVNGENVI